MWRSRVDDIARGAARADMRADADDPVTALRSAFDELFRSSGLLGTLDRVTRRVATAQASYVSRVTKLPVGDIVPQSTIERFRQENVRLITAMREEHVQDIASVLRRAAAAGQRHEEFAAEIAERVGVGLSRAKLIARDQTNKLNSQLNRAAAESAGVEEYTWSTSRSDNVRPSHRRLEGQRFRFDDPPVTNEAGDRNNPGEDYQCNCVAIPVIPLFEGLGLGDLEAPSAPAPTLPPARRRTRRAEGPVPAPGELVVRQQGMRPESLAHLRSGGAASEALPVTVAYYPGRTEPVIIDGRHRITVARERGETSVIGDIIEYGPRGGERRRRGVRIPI